MGTKPTTDRLPVLDFARGFSMLAVVLFHVLQPFAHGIWANAVSFGGAGVHVFVLISGFGLLLSCRRKSLEGFYSRRFRSILVPYYVFVTAVFLLNLVVPLYPRDGAYALAGHLLLFKAFDESIIGSFGYPLWFLSTIVQLYAVFPLLYRAYQRWGSRWTLGVTFAVYLAFSAVAIGLGRTDERVFQSSGLVYLWEFVLGMVLADLAACRGICFWETPLKWLLPTTALALVADVVMVKAGGDVGKFLNNPFALLAFLGILLIAYRMSTASVAAPVRRLVMWAGAISYETYLMHTLVLRLVLADVSHYSPLLQCVAAMAAFVVSLLAGAWFQKSLAVCLSRPIGWCYSAAARRA